MLRQIVTFLNTVSFSYHMLVTQSVITTTAFADDSNNKRKGTEI
jgi:hypothetical protein